MSGSALGRLSQYRRDHLILNSMAPPTRLETRQLRLLETRKILPEPLSDIRADQWLVAGEAKLGRNLLQVFDHVLRDAHADRRHRPTPSKSLRDAFFTGLHQASVPQPLPARRNECTPIRLKRIYNVYTSSKRHHLHPSA